MALERFSIDGQEQEDDDGEVLVRGDSRRSLVRYREDSGESYVSSRMNRDLLAAASSLPIVRVMPFPPADQVLPRNGLLTVDGSVKNYVFRDRIVETLAAQQCRACLLAERHGEGRRDFFFTTEDPRGFGKAVADAAGEMTVETRVLLFTEAAVDFLPYEFFGELGVAVSALHQRQKVRFGFWGAEETLGRLRSQLESRGFQFGSFEMAVRELRMTRVVSIEPAAFHAVLVEIVTLSRGLGCSYRGEETVEGGEQFLLTNPVPERYMAKKESFFSRFFGGKGR